jgi:pimeloyl-ACP methyl ester carboxylesterase
MSITQTSVGPVAWEERGSGPPLLLLSANPGDRRDWDAVIPDLARDHRVIAVDWPGHGESPAPEPPRSASAMMYATVLAELTAALGIEGAIVVGNSVGGYAAVRLALEHPARVARLVLVDPGGFTRHGFGSRAFCAFKGREWVTRRIAGRFARRYLRRRTPWTAAMIARADAERGNPAQVAVDAAIWRSFTDAAHDLRGRAGAIAQPTLLVWGRHDPVLRADRDGREARAAMPSARWVDLDTGHAPFAEDPDAFLAAVREFLA